MPNHYDQDIDPVKVALSEKLRAEKMAKKHRLHVLHSGANIIAIDFAIEQGPEGIEFLKDWREGVVADYFKKSWEEYLRDYVF